MKRNQEIKVRFNKRELQDLDKKVKKTGLSREGYIRTVLAGKTPVEIPPAPYYELAREVHALGNAMNQLAYRANVFGMIDVQTYQRNASRVIELGDRLALICLPREDGAR